MFLTIYRRLLNTLRIDKDKIGGIIIFALIFLISLAGILYHTWLDGLPQDYTIGEIIDIWKPAKGGRLVAYKYQIKEIEYEYDVSLYSFEDVAKVGRRFLVEYPEGHLGRGVMLLDKPVPDNVVAPEDGWDEMPEFARQESR